MKQHLRLATLVFGLLASASVWAGEFVLHPNGFGPESYAAWKAKQGIPDDPDEETEFQQRGTRELLHRLRKQVPSVRSLQRRSGRRSMGTDIFS